MSVTTTANPVNYTLEATLADYNLHHTDDHDTGLNAHPNPAAEAQHNPSHWPTDHRRVPPYRPINTELDQASRRIYLNGFEWTFVNVMFTGVLLQATASKVWRSSFGRVWDVGYKLGGEW